ncbi:hypothetical protein BG015_011900 [Linnemannia schmuckeri]|uniref:Uncharacterized protein n=1 Tax=Linnemannia schmuckeri TaxID=64567 RepID=A0A9P5RS17_9FUNG|nr:hypothetical protein BG015_011900 [Linnemannia schmuckeri]
MSQIHEIPDYNKMYNTSSYASTHPLEPAPHTQIQFTTSTNSPPPSQPLNTTGYGPLDSGYGMTPVTTSTNNNTVNMAPFQAPASSTSQRTSGSGSGGQAHRRSSVGNLFNSMIGVDNSQQIPMRKTVSQPATTNTSNSGRRRSSIARFLMPDSQPNGGSSANLGRRRSSAFTSLGYKTDAGGDEHKGPYAHISRAQAEHMDRVREAERNLNLTHNKDGLPLPKDNMMQAGGRRRSSLAKILGFDKPLLAR